MADEHERITESPAGQSEADEEAVLRELYGEPDADGIYRGET